MDLFQQTRPDLEKIVDDLELLIDSSLDLLLQHVVDSSRKLIDAPFAGLIILAENDPNIYEYFKVSGWKQPDYFPQGHGLFSIPYKTGQVVRIDHIARHPQSVGAPQEHPPMQAFLATPCMYKQRILGSIFLAKSPGEPGFSKEDEELLVTYAAQASMIIEFARKCMQAKEQANLQERIRMKERLHDTVSQTLFALGQEVDLFEKWIEQSPDSLNKEKAKESIERIRKLASQSLAEIRAALFSLSEGIKLVTPIAPSFNTLIEEFERASKIKTELIIRGDLDTVPSPILQCIFKVIGESLSNVQRHSQSSSAIVSITIEDNKVIACVQDAGIGISSLALTHLFSPTSHFGLRSMKSIVEEMNGIFKIFNNDDGGTTIRVELPLLWRV